MQHYEPGHHASISVNGTQSQYGQYPKGPVQTNRMSIQPHPIKKSYLDHPNHSHLDARYIQPPQTNQPNIPNSNLAHVFPNLRDIYPISSDRIAQTQSVFANYGQVRFFFICYVGRIKII